MFRSATTRIAHNSTVPGLARISKDLKALQELINAEKAVLQTLQKLAQDLAKSSDALKQWGNGEGDDLGDTLTGCHAVLLHFASALSRFSSNEASVRELMKAVRTREENLDELKRRRKSLQSNADSADRKLSKMSAENKNFQAQADALNKLRDEIRSMDTDIMTEEASLCDFKRSSARSWLGIKFGALQECCERGLIVGELGKLIIAEIPSTPTQPGLPRPYYTGHARTEYLVSEAQRAVNEVMFSTDPNPRPIAMGIHALPGSELPPVQMSHTGSSQMTPSMITMAPSSLGGTPEPSIRNSRRFSQNVISPAAGFVGLPEVSESTVGGLGLSPLIGPDQPRSPPPHNNGSVVSLSHSNPFATPAQQQMQLSNTDVAEFGVYPAVGGAFSPRSSSLRNLGDSQPSSPVTTGGPRSNSRFATFPVKAMGPRAQPGSIPMPTPIAPAMDMRAPSIDVESPNDSFSSSVAQALGRDWLTGQPSPTPPANAKEMEASRSPTDYTSPPPQYSATAEPISGTMSTYEGGTLGGNLARASATPSIPPSITTSTVPEEDEEEEGLAYMSPVRDEHASVSSEPERSDDGRRVRFESVPDVNETAGPEGTVQRETEAHEQREVHEGYDEPHIQNGSSPEAEVKPKSPSLETQRTPSQPPAVSVLVPVSLIDSPSPTSAPPPAEDEQSLNAAAAREVSREMDALMFSPPGTYPGSAAPPPPPSLQPRASPFPQGRVSPARPESLRDTPASPPLTPRNDINVNYVRERDRSPSIPPASPASDGGRSPVLQQSPSGTDTPLGLTEGRSGPPPSISLPPIRSMSPTFSSISGSTPYRTPPELPASPAGPGSFYNLPTLSGSGTLPSSGRTVAAGLFKRQMRSATSPAPVQDGSIPSTGDVSPLNVKKRALPASPRPPYAQRQSDDGLRPRVPSSTLPEGGAGADYAQPRSISTSSLRPVEGDAARPQSVVRGSMYDDDYDYISAYVDDPTSTDGRRASTAGYGQAHYATNLEQ